MRGEPLTMNDVKNENIPGGWRNEMNNPEILDTKKSDYGRGDYGNSTRVAIELHDVCTNDVGGETLSKYGLNKEVLPEVVDENKCDGGMENHANSEKDTTNIDELHAGWIRDAVGELSEIETLPVGRSKDSGKIDIPKSRKQKNTTAQENCIMNLFGLSVWWDRVCRPEKRLNAKQSNQNAKLQFMSNLSPSVVARQKNILTNRPEKSVNPTEGSIRNVQGVMKIL